MSPPTPALPPHTLERQQDRAMRGTDSAASLLGLDPWPASP